MNLNTGGILCMDKPAEHTSFDVVARMRGIAKTRKIGHGGTLDPMATGVLPLFFGRATKACDLIPVEEKRYTATFRLGLTTDTQDITGTVLVERPVTATTEDVRRVLARFTGAQKQTPPMYSAVQVNGRRLYDLAREGIEVERPARDVTIHRADLLDADEGGHLYTIDVVCSRGTYIRTLCHDMGEALGAGAVLTALRRTESCGFTLDKCITLREAEELSARGELESRLLPVEAVFASLPRLTLNVKDATRFGNGVKLQMQPSWPTKPCAVFREDNMFLGLAHADSEGLLQMDKLFYIGES
jgi:tRNA pseudouridine55 synthase